MKQYIHRTGVPVKIVETTETGVFVEFGLNARNGPVFFENEKFELFFTEVMGDED